MKLNIFATALILLVACVNATDKQTTTPSLEELQEQNRALIDKYFQFFNDHNWAELSAMYSEEADFKDPSLGSSAVRLSRDSVAARYAEMAGMIDKLHDEVLAIYPSGKDYVIVEFISTGTLPDGTRFELPICTVFKIMDGSIVADYTYYDDF